MVGFSSSSISTAVFCSEKSVEKLKGLKFDNVSDIWNKDIMKRYNWLTSRFYNAVDIVDGRYGQKQTGSNCSNRHVEAVVQSPTGSHPLLKRQGTPSHGVKTTRPCSVPRMARACSTDAPRIAHPAALTPWQGRRHLRQEKRAPFRLRHNDRVKKGAPPYLNSCPFSFPLSLSCHRFRERGYFKKGSFSAKETGHEPSY